jgi:hypothetical protein
MGSVSVGGRGRAPRRPHVGIAFHRAWAFWAGTMAIAVGVLLHLPMFFASASMGYRLAGMPMSREMLSRCSCPAAA